MKTLHKIIIGDSRQMKEVLKDIWNSITWKEWQIPGKNRNDCSRITERKWKGTDELVRSLYDRMILRWENTATLESYRTW